MNVSRYRRLFVYTWAMARRPKIRTGMDVRDFGFYTIPQAAHYLNIPTTTLRWWVEGRRARLHGRRRRRFYPPLIEIADRRNHLLSFFNLVEAHVLSATRHKKVSMHDVRGNLDYLKKVTGQARPLLTSRLETFGRFLFVRGAEGEPINVSRAE